MATYLAFHEVDDVRHSLNSPKREEIFGPMGITVRTFHDPEGSSRVGLIAEIPTSPPFSSSCSPSGKRGDGVRRRSPRDTADSQPHQRVRATVDRRSRIPRRRTARSSGEHGVVGNPPLRRGTLLARRRCRDGQLPVVTDDGGRALAVAAGSEREAIIGRRAPNSSLASVRRLSAETPACRAEAATTLLGAWRIWNVLLSKRSGDCCARRSGNPRLPEVTGLRSHEREDARKRGDRCAFRSCMTGRRLRREAQRGRGWRPLP